MDSAVFCQPRPDRVQVLFHSWYNAPKTTAAADQFDRDQMHGGWVENFKWTRVAGADMPPEPKPVIPRDLVGQLDPAQVRTAAPDGMLGGAYARPDEDMQVVWDAGVAEVRELLESGWRSRPPSRSAFRCFRPSRSGWLPISPPSPGA